MYVHVHDQQGPVYHACLCVLIVEIHDTNTEEIAK